MHDKARARSLASNGQVWVTETHWSTNFFFLSKNISAVITMVDGADVFNEMKQVL